MQEIKTNPTVRHTTPLQLLAAFAATVAVLFVLLLGACALPAQPVLEHVYDSAQTIQQEGLYPEYFGFKLFQMDNVELSFEQDAIEAIADKALERKTGARGLRSIMESVMMDTMYEIPSDDTIEECVVTKAAVDGESEPLTIHGESLKKAK